MFCGECGSAVYPPEAERGKADTADIDDAFQLHLNLEPADADGNPTRVVELAEAPLTWRLPPAIEASGAGLTPPSPASVESAPVDESTRMPERARVASARFTLHFSTGESVTVDGTGLIGRRPIPQPGEYFDALITIDDPGRSVSKIHLEFGQDGGVFWISDRYSANGTVIREPERQPRLCAAGMRARVSRGSRVDIGEQFFLVT